MTNDFAVIETGGKQYRVTAGTKLKVEKLEVKAGDKVVFDTVLLTSVGDAVKVGAPYVAGAKTEAKVIGDGARQESDRVQISSEDPRAQEEGAHAGIYRARDCKDIETARHIRLPADDSSANMTGCFCLWYNK